MKNYLFPLNAIHKDGHVVLLYTLDEVYAFIRKYGKFHEYRTSSGERIVSYKYDYSQPRAWSRYIPVYEYFTVVNDWIVRDDRGRRVKYDDIPSRHSNYDYYNSRRAELRKFAEKGLPIPGTGCRKAGWKMNHTAKKNSGAGHRNRNRAICEYDRKEYGISNPYGKPMPWEGY